MLKFNCPQCDTKYELDDSLAGRKISCEVCGKHFVIPKQETVADLDATLPGKRFRNSDAADNKDDFDATKPNAHVRLERGDLRVGDLVLKRYILTERLGAGAMGMVFKCEDQISGVQYALKTVPPEIARDDESMEAIRSNFQMVHNLKHPNIAGADFLDRDEYGAYYLMMEYAPGQSLASWLRKKGKPEFDEVCKIVAQIASALDYAHSQKILHRDIKPANIKVDENGNVKVLDFGLASKVRSTMTNLSFNAANTSGTPNYMPPEQFKAQYPRPASDQYALAVLTYEMLAGHLPFEADNFEVLRSAVINDEPEEIEGISENAWLAIKKAMSKKAQDRFENCTQFAKAIREEEKAETPPPPKTDTMQPETPVTPPPVNPPETDVSNEKPRKKKKTPAVYLIFSVVALVVFVFIAIIHSDDSVSRYTSASQPAVLLQPTVEYSSEAERKYRKSAEQGDADAQFNLGRCYYNGQGVDKDYTQAVYWYRKSAEQGQAGAQNNLGVCYESGRGVEKDLTQAVHWYRKSAEQGDADAQNSLGECYYRGEGIAKDFVQAVNWYRKSAEQGDAAAQYNLGLCYNFGRGVDKDYTQAVHWYRKSAEQGNARAQCNLGECYCNGQGVDKDYTQAVYWYRKSVEQGNAAAQFNLGWCYQNGQGVDKDYTQAVYWYRKSAEHGNAAAQYSLGECYYYGRGVDTDYTQAVNWYRKSAEQGNAAAQNSLGWCYERGRGVDEDYTQAEHWYRKSAEQGNARAQGNLGDCYYFGRGVDKDYTQTVYWYRKSAEQGDAYVQYSLGLCYERGRGVEKDLSLAIEWYKKAAAQGYKLAKDNLRQLGIE